VRASHRACETSAEELLLTTARVGRNKGEMGEGAYDISFRHLSPKD
jgi:hypothetical protein